MQRLVKSHSNCKDETREDDGFLFILICCCSSTFQVKLLIWTGERERETKDQMPVCILCILDSWWFPETLCNFTVQLLRALLRMFLSHQTAVQVWTLQWRSIPRTRLNTSMIQSYRKLCQNVESCVHRTWLFMVDSKWKIHSAQDVHYMSMNLQRNLDDHNLHGRFIAPEEAPWKNSFWNWWSWRNGT